MTPKELLLIFKKEREIGRGVVGLSGLNGMVRNLRAHLRGLTNNALSFGRIRKVGLVGKLHFFIRV
jgi:hypothetical protein